MVLPMNRMPQWSERKQGRRYIHSRPRRTHSPFAHRADVFPHGPVRSVDLLQVNQNWEWVCRPAGGPSTHLAITTSALGEALGLQHFWFSQNQRAS